MFHFITGLPRSGSTLLGALLNQNPRFTGGMSTSLIELVQANLCVLNGANSNMHLNISDEQRDDFIRGVFESWRANVASSEVVFDCNRGWANQLPLINKIFPQSKVIACIRNPAWIVDSFEKITRDNPTKPSKIFGNSQYGQSVYQRANFLMSGNAILGGSLGSTRGLYYSSLSEKVLLLDYEILTREPEQALRLIYQFLEEPWFDHDFENVEYSAETFDDALATPGLHTVKRVVEYKERKTLLPPDLFEDLAKAAFWTDLTETNATAIVGTCPTSTPTGQV